MALVEILQRKYTQAKGAEDGYRPLFFRLNENSDRQALFQLAEIQPALQICDSLEGQLVELVRTLHPSQKLTASQLSAKIREHTGDVPAEEYGVWVYYPWSNRLVHILDENEFIRLRTSRNQYKITPEEQAILASKRIGVIGLSVGQSVALTMAMERTFGEIRLADFDSLELTNLNRIRTGIHNLGVPKVVITAREIAEIDPFLKVVCFQEGVTEANIHNFFLHGGKLDLLIEECDGIDMKIASRLKARELGIPVVMEASDRCTFDVERFDLEPDQSILHGLIDHLDVSKLKTLETSEEKIPYLLPMIGLETSSQRLKASLLEIGQTINTWPQLASAVALGGGMTTDVVRRIFLNQFYESGRYFLDIEEIVGNKRTAKRDDKLAQTAILETTPLLSSEMERLAHQIPDGGDVRKQILSKAQITQLVKFAIQAPSAGNSQPWKWLYANGNLFLFHDTAHQYPFGDPANQAVYTSLGAAVENLILAAQSAGYSVWPCWFPLKNDTRMVGLFQFYEPGTDIENIEPIIPPQLFSYIPTRYTERYSGARQAIPDSQLELLRTEAGKIPGASLEIVQDAESIQQLGEIIAGAERVRVMHPEGHQEVFTKEIRWSREDAVSSGDGLDITTFGLSPSEEAGFRVARDPNVVRLLNEWKGGKGFEKLGRKAVASASALGLITIPSFTPTNFVSGGRAVQRVWLTATSMGLAIQPLTAPIYLFNHLKHKNDARLSPSVLAVLEQWRTQFESIFPVLAQRTDLFLFRLTKASQPVTRSLRRDPERVLHFEKTRTS